MIPTKLTQLIFQLNAGTSLKRYAASPVARYNINRQMCSKAESNYDKPIKYSTSKAATWKAEYTRNPNYKSVAPPWQHHVLAVSLATFMIYFFILREENDLDKIFTRDLDFYIKQDAELKKKA